MSTSVNTRSGSVQPTPEILPRDTPRSATAAEHAPAFLDAAGCTGWLARVPLANLSLAQPILLRQLELLRRHALAPETRLAILETLRHPVSEVQADAAQIFAGRPLPLAPPEQAALESTLEIWRLLTEGYLVCFCTLREAGDERAALMAQRSLAAFADWQVDLCRGEQLPDGGYWRQLHQTFAAAESLGIAEMPVSDPLRHGGTPTSALAAYAECNLLCTASPYELSARHMTWVARWARRWGAKLGLLKAPPEDIRNHAVPLWVDLDSAHPPDHVTQPAGNGRWLDTTELRKSLAKRIALLEQGRAPAGLQLGDDVTQPAAGQLLQRVLQRWCAGGAQRREERHAASGACHVVAGFEAVCFHLGGRQPFRAPSRDDATLRREQEEFETFGDHRHSTQTLANTDDRHVENWLVMNDWRVLNESATGMRIARPLQMGVRIGAGMLIAVKVGSSQHYVLASVRWALRGADDMLQAGIQFFPGEAQLVAMRVIDPGEPAGAWRQSLLLPEIPAPHAPASLLVPAGCFKLDRRVEVMVDHAPRMLKLLRVLDRGSDFERCSLYARE